MARGVDGRLGLLKCAKPYLVGGVQPVPCGQCGECRVRLKLEAVFRAQLELADFQARGLSASVWTLTLAPAHVPALGSLSRGHTRSFVRRVTVQFKRKFGIKVRAWGPGEYGDRGGRPHYHLVLFGVDARNPSHVEVARSCWCVGRGSERDALGRVYVDDAARSGVMEYLAAYCVKKWNRPTVEELRGRLPEFMVWPQRPPLGGAFADVLVRALDTQHGRAEVARLGQDVPLVVRQSGRVKVIPRTLRRRVRSRLGLDEPAAKAVRALHQSVRLRGDMAEFVGDWYSRAAHADVEGIDQAQRRRRVFASAKRSRSL